MKISVLITLIAATIIVGISTFSERPGAVELRGRKGGRLEPRLPTTPWSWRMEKIAKAKSKLWGNVQQKAKEFKFKLQQTKKQAWLRANRRKWLANLNCPTDGFTSQCARNFAGGLDPSLEENNLKDLNGIAPKGLDSLALGQTASFGTICENGIVAVLYDCNARSALYAATVIDGAYFTGAKKKLKRKSTWKTTRDTTLSKHPEKLAKNNDYKCAREHNHCYEDQNGMLWNWDGTGPCYNPKPFIAIHKGHLIAAYYGKTHGTQDSIDATFSYTNAVPQEGSFNTDPWRVAEGKLMNRAKACQETAMQNGMGAKTYVVVGVIPSSFLGKPKFFGSAGFGSYQGEAKWRAGSYSISLPGIMWTAACCILTNGKVEDKFGFWRHNIFNPPKEKVKETDSLFIMFEAIRQEISQAGFEFNIPTVFPSFPACDLD